MFTPYGLGDRVKDSVTGFTGIVVCIGTWLHGCIRVTIQPEKLKDGKQPEMQTFDQSQLILVKAGVQKPQVLSVQDAPKPETRRSSGGPAREPRDFARR